MTHFSIFLATCFLLTGCATNPTAPTHYTSSKDDPCPELTAIGFKAWVGGADGYLADSPFPLPKKCPECESADITYVRIQSDFPCGGWTCANNHWGGLHPAR